MVSYIYSKAISLVAVATHLSGTTQNPEYVRILLLYEEAVSNAIAENWGSPWKLAVVELEALLSNTIPIIVCNSDLLILCLSIRATAQQIKNDIDGDVYCLDELSDEEILHTINNLANCSDIDRIREKIQSVTTVSSQYVKFMEDIKCSINYEELVTTF